MKNEQNLSVNGLANIAKLLDKGPTPPVAAKPDSRVLISDISRKTYSNIGKIVFCEIPNDKDFQAAQIQRFLDAAVRDAYRLGRTEALAQNSVVEAALEKQYADRTESLVPAVVGAVMEQLGLIEVALDLDQLGTVFSRNRIEFSASDANVIIYTLHPVDEVSA